MRISELAEEYCFHFIFNEKTAKNYTSIARVFERDTEIKSITEVDRNLLSVWKREILANKSYYTFNSYLRQLRTLFKFAVEEGYLSTNPFDRVKMAPVNKRLLKTVDIELIKNAIRYLDTGLIEPGWFWQIVIRFLATTGVRRRQLVSMQWGDIYHKTSEVLLSHRGSKTYREWLIPIDDTIKSDLDFLFRQSSIISPQSPQDQVFNVCLHYHRYKGVQMNEEQLDGFFRRLSGRLGQKISTHRIRHTLGTELGKRDDVNIFVLQDLFGHTDIRTTRLYVKTDTNAMRKMLKKVDLFE